MRNKEFIKDKLYFIMIAILTGGISALFLYAIQVNIQVIIIIELLLWGLVLATLAVEYIRRFMFYNQLFHSLDSLDKKYLITEIIEEPLFMDGKILYDTMCIVNKSMAENVNIYRLAQNEYKDYIEMWVHEIKTPLAAAKLIINNHPSEITASIQEEFHKVEGFVEQALYYARSTNPEKDYIIKKLEVKEVVTKVVRKHAKSFIYKKIKVELQDLDVFVYSDSKWIEFILDQIITNALKYTPETSGIIKIYTENHEHAIALHIQDNGAGIESTDIQRVFEKGFTGLNGRLNEKATGMGLYLCKMLCDKLYLGIHLESVPNQGTTVTLDFPISKLMLLK